MPAKLVRPGRAVHRDEEAARGERGRKQEDFEVFISAIMLYRNSQVCFHKGMVTGEIMKVSRARRHARPVV